MHLRRKSHAHTVLHFHVPSCSLVVFMVLRLFFVTGNATVVADTHLSDEGASIQSVSDKATTWASRAVNSRFLGYETIVRDTHQASIAARKIALQKFAARKDTYWPPKAWGETLWALCALYLNEKTDVANHRLLERAQPYIKAQRAKASGSDFPPKKMGDLSPWAYFSLTDYVRILCLFGGGSPHYPGRLQPETEAAMKEALWWHVKGKSRVADASLDNLLVLLGTENHDLTSRPSYYLVAAMLKDDPSFKDRRYDDGHKAVDHYAAYNQFFQEWPVQRIKYGLWVEIGSCGYMKYSWPSLFNLNELSPDPLVRKRFGMLLDIAFIEEAQISFRGRRGGGRSRATYGGNNFENYKNLLYVPEGQPADASHSKVILTSTYQLPAAAILLRKMAFPASKPFVISNRVLGELEIENQEKGKLNLAADSALVNYAYRTPHYILGSTLQNPALSMLDPGGGEPILKYAGISRQNRWCGLLFCDPEAQYPKHPQDRHRDSNEQCAIFPVIGDAPGGRPQHSHWSFQHRDVLFIQRIDNLKGMGSYSTGQLSMRFYGKKLKKIEQNGWIFASNGKAFAAVRFLDSDYTWDESGELASPLVGAGIPTTTRILMHSGDIDEYASFETFRLAVLANDLSVTRTRVRYKSRENGVLLECFLYDAHKHKQFRLPTIGGQAIDLRPDWTFRSPFLNNPFGGHQVKVSVDPVQEVYDFGNETE